MLTKARRKRPRNSEGTSSSLLTTIFEHTSRGVQYQIYPVGSCCGFTPITKRRKWIISYNLICLLHQVDIIQKVKKVIEIHNSDENNICNLLVDLSIKFIMDQNIIKVLHHINILLNYSTQIVTQENYSISTLYFWKLYEIANEFLDYALNEMACT